MPSPPDDRASRTESLLMDCLSRYRNSLLLVEEHKDTTGFRVLDALAAQDAPPSSPGTGATTPSDAPTHDGSEGSGPSLIRPPSFRDSFISLHTLHLQIPPSLDTLPPDGLPNLQAAFVPPPPRLETFSTILAGGKGMTTNPRINPPTLFRRHSNLPYSHTRPETMFSHTTLDARSFYTAYDGEGAVPEAPGGEGEELGNMRTVRFMDLPRREEVAQGGPPSVGGGSVMSEFTVRSLEGEDNPPIAKLPPTITEEILDVFWQSLFPPKVEDAVKGGTFAALHATGNVVQWVSDSVQYLLSSLAIPSLPALPSSTSFHLPTAASFQFRLPSITSSQTDISSGLSSLTDGTASSGPSFDETPPLGVWWVDSDGVGRRLWAGMSVTREGGVGK